VQRMAWWLNICIGNRFFTLQKSKSQHHANESHSYADQNRCIVGKSHCNRNSSERNFGGFLLYLDPMNYFLSIVILISGICLGQNKYYVLPENQSFNLYEKQEDELIKLEELKFKYTELYAFDADELVIVNDDSTKFHYGRIKHSKFEEKLVKEFPEKFKINTIELKDGFVYFGGSWSDGELFYVFDLNSKEFYPIPIPDEAFKIGKAIDDILFFDEKIIAVDNIREPKFLIDYNSEELPGLKTARTFQLESNGTYEQIHKGDVNEHYMILLSETVSGYIGFSNHIMVLKTSDYSQGFSVDSRKKSEFNSPFVHWNDILL